MSISPQIIRSKEPSCQTSALEQVTENPSHSLADGPLKCSNLPKIPICYVIPSIDTPRAGTERHLLQLLQSLDRKVFDPLLVVLRHSPWTRKLGHTDLPIRVLGIRSLWSPASWIGIFRLARIMRRHGTKVAELYFVEGHFLGAIAAKLAAVSLVLSWRRDLAYQYGRKEKWMTKIANPLVTRILANSNAVRDAISQIEGIPQDRFDVIYNGVDLDKFDRQTQQSTSDQFQEFSKDKRVVSLLANLRPIKNIRCFLQAARLVAEDRDDVVFLVLGSGEEEVALKRYADELGINHRIFWAGSVSEPAPYLKRSEVGCLSSDSEGLPNAVVEYMAAGLPVVATAVGGIPEVVIDGVTGFL
ncbi:MAG: glycosyltransferase, partial [Planctomycetes bacterium]|nr:glycosyltransferase [Planctomycetota bacterium]